MAVNYSSDIKDARLQAVIDGIDGGSGAGTLEICTSGYANVLAVLTLADPCGTKSGGVLTFDTSPALQDTSANATGTAAAARIKDSSGNVKVNNMSVGISGSGADVILGTTSIVSGQLVQITSATITHAA